MFTAWVVFVAACLFAGLETKVTAFWVGSFALFTFFVFATPVTAIMPPKWQLRLWYLLIATSIVWGVLLVSLVFHEPPVRMFTEPWPGSLLTIWIVAYAGGSSALYLSLLWLVLRKKVRPGQPSTLRHNS